MKTYIIEGNPTALKRPRYSSKTNRMYNPQRSHMLVISISLQNQHDNDPIFEGPLHMDVTFYMPYSSRVSKRKINKVREAIANNQPVNYLPADTRPDLDNLIKLLADCCTGVLYQNDAIITSITAKKVYDDNPRTEFSIRPL
jgi:Holliday junction resolvase RusA-like endonuclease